MRKQFFLFMMACLFAMSAWAADISVTEKFTQVKKPGTDINTTTTADGLIRFGDVCGWNFQKLRYTTDYITVGSTNVTAVWLNKVSNTEYSELATTNLEGGIKAVSFRWAQFGKETGNTLKLKVAAGAIEHNPAITRDGNTGADYDTGGTEYTHSFECKTNGQLVITNVSDKTGNACRILVCNIAITPYLLYRNKDVTVGLKQRGYANDGAQDFINNTGGEGSITYSSDDTNIATVDEENGVITPVGVGTTTITATWSEGASTTYTLHVVDGIIAENFSKVVQTGQTTGADWHGDLWDWKVANVRRGEADTLGLNPRIQATALRSNAGSTLISDSIEGGVKHIAFDWRQWGAKGTATKMNIKFYYSTDKDNWGDAVATQEVDAATASTPFEFNEDVTGGAKNAYLKMEYTADAAIVAVMGAMKITPYLLYTTKAATLDTRNGLTFTNNDLINNTTGAAVEYSIAPIAPTESGATIDANNGQVTATDETEGEFIVKAKWGDVETTYTLTIVSRIATTASFAQSAVRVGLDALGIGNPLTYTDGYNGTIEYASSNTAVATVDSETGAISFAGGVGQTTITATLPQTDDYKAASASYIIYVRDENARKEAFTGITGGVPSDGDLHDWGGDLFMWQRQYQVRRSGNDTIHAGTDKHQATSIGVSTSPAAPSILQSKEPVEGGIKYLSFYWAQWGAANNCTRRITVYADDVKIGEQENPNGAAGRNGEEFLLGINNAMKSNKQLIIKNESYKGNVETLADNASRIVLDNIYITPYLLYTKKEHSLYAGDTYTNTELINNTGGNDIAYSLEDNDGEASIDAGTGEVTALAAGEVTVKAEWSEGAFTTYTLTILSKVVTEASYPNPIVRLGLGDELPANALGYSEGYDGTIGYASSNPAVATVTSEGVVSLAGGVGQATITATLPVTDNYEAAEAKYTIYVRDNGARIEDFSNVHIGDGVVGDAGTDWSGRYPNWINWWAEGAIRHNASDTIWGKTNPDNVKVWIATAASTNATPVSAGVMASKEEIEGGIKYLSFYWKQWGSESGRTLRIAAFDGEERKGYMEYVPNGASTQEKFLLGVNDMMRNNHRLYIKNESFKTETFDGTIADDGTASRSRIIIDDIYITPWLLYTNKDEQVMRVGDTYTREPNINNTEGESGALSYESSDPTVASVNAEGTVTAIARGKVIITAKYQWNEEEVVTTTYPVTVWPGNCETFSNGATASTYAANEESAAGDKATWTARLAGINVGDFEPNVAFIRAPRQGEDKEAYLESSAIAGGIASMTFDWNLVAGETTTNWDIRILINGREVKRLGNDDLATAKMENFAQIAIDGINEPDNFVIRFENHSTINGTYTTGNKGRFVIDNITWTSYAGVKVLAEDANNEGWIRANGGQIVDVTISRSSLVANVWNTLCLPFAISKASDLGDAEVKEMTSVAMEGEILNIYFSDIEGDELQAGKPYMVKPAANKELSGTYNDKQISSIASPVKYGDVTMLGMFSPVNVTKDDYNTLFVGTPDAEGNNLFYPQADGTLRGLRAYFKIGGAPLPAPRRARYVVTQKDVVTGIESVQNSDVRIQKIIRDGQLFIIRDGKMYNAQGQVIK